MFEAAPENYSDPAILAKMTVRNFSSPVYVLLNYYRTSLSFIISDSFKLKSQRPLEGQRIPGHSEVLLI